MVFVVLAVGGLYVAAQQKPGVAQGLRPVPTSSAATQSFDNKLDAIQKAADDSKKSGKTQMVEVAFSEEELTSKASQAASLPNDSGVTAQNTQIHLAGSQVIATSTVTVGGLTVNVGVVADLVIANGQTQIVVRDVQTGAIPLPDAIKQQINAQIGGAIDPARLGLPIDVSQLQIVNGQLVIRGTTRP